ncbi:MAG: hypothetical protein OHK0046_21500 [Anaerolineae bacterium]
MSAKLSLLVVFLLVGCTMTNDPAVPTSSIIAPTPNVQRWQDANPVMQGICFAAAADAAGRVFVLRSAAELQQFYDLADNSRLCRRPVMRGAFEFTEGRVLAGLWSTGTGCTARHDTARYEKTASTLTIDLTFVTEGACGYELVRPFWIALENAAQHEILINVGRGGG